MIWNYPCQCQLLYTKSLKSICSVLFLSNLAPCSLVIWNLSKIREQFRCRQHYFLQLPALHDHLFTIPHSNKNDNNNKNQTSPKRPYHNISHRNTSDYGISTLKPHCYRCSQNTGLCNQTPSSGEEQKFCAASVSWATAPGCLWLGCVVHAGTKALMVIFPLPYISDS